MSFLYPLGLLGLIGIPVLIAIYIIKNKYTEQVVSSTYLWTLSEKFLRKRLPINKLVGILSLILQILAVLFMSFAVAHPVLKVGNSAYDYCFVLDASASMNFEHGGVTRFDSAKGEIERIINSSADGSKYTLVLAGSDTDTVFENVDDKDRARKLLGEVTCEYTSGGYVEAIGVAQGYFNQSPAARTYLFTDKEIADGDNVRVVYVGSAEENYALTDLSYELEGGRAYVRGKAVSYASDALLTVELRFDGAENAAAVQTVQASKLEAAPFAFEVVRDTFESAEVRIAEKDALMQDNEVILYNVQFENSYSALIVSDAPFFLKAALATSGKSRTDVVASKDYNGATGYDLYIFDGYSPASLPSDGAVWFLNPPKNVEDAGFLVRDTAEFSVGQKLSYTQNSASIVRSLLRDVERDDVYVLKYRRCGLYRNFTTILTCEGNPMVFTGTNRFGNREVVFAFDLHDSNFPVLGDYVTLCCNLLDYTFPTVIDELFYYCGDSVRVNVTANCDSIRVDTPGGKIRYLDTSSAVSETELTEAGSYLLTMMSGDTARVFNVYAAVPEAERTPAGEQTSFALVGETAAKGHVGRFDTLIIIFVALAVIFAADWVVYCYEQYQLR